MEIKELIWLAHGMELKNTIDAIANSEWSNNEEFQDIVDIETSTLMTALYVDDAFNEYDESEIQSAVIEIIENYINEDYYKE